MSAVELDLDAIRARVDAATEGPWYQGRESRQYETARDVFSGPDMETAHDIATYCWSTADAEFITHARTDVPALLTEVERLRDSNAYLESRVQRGDDATTEARAALADTVPAAALRELADTFAAEAVTHAQIDATTEDTYGHETERVGCLCGDFLYDANADVDLIDKAFRVHVAARLRALLPGARS